MVAFAQHRQLLRGANAFDDPGDGIDVHAVGLVARETQQDGLVAAVALARGARAIRTASPRSRATRSSSPRSRSRSANCRAARIGPTVCELEGPMPILNRSKTLNAMRHCTRHGAGPAADDRGCQATSAGTTVIKTATGRGNPFLVAVQVRHERREDPARAEADDGKHAGPDGGGDEVEPEESSRVHVGQTRARPAVRCAVPTENAWSSTTLTW